MNLESSSCTDLRAAFCDRYRCTPDAFLRKAFWKGLPIHAKILSAIFGGISHPRYQQDLEVIRSIGEGTTLDEIYRALDEMWSLHEMNRDLTRRYLGLRISTQRIQDVFISLVGRVTVKEPEVELRAPVSLLKVRSRTDEGQYRSAEVATRGLRRALRIHSMIVQGRDLDDILAEERMSRGEFDGLLNEFARLRPEIGWLKGYLRDREEAESLRNQLRRMPAMTIA